MASKRQTRDEWRKRVDRWKASGLTAAEFAAETGINAGTLQFWRYKLSKAAREATAKKDRRPDVGLAASLIELRPPVPAVGDARFEIELANGRRIRVPVVFDGGALRTLISALEAAS
jgi:transposase-like protein